MGFSPHLSKVLSQENIMLAFREFPEDRWNVAMEQKEKISRSQEMKT